LKKKLNDDLNNDKNPVVYVTLKGLLLLKNYMSSNVKVIFNVLFAGEDKATELDIIKPYCRRIFYMHSRENKNNFRLINLSDEDKKEEHQAKKTETRH